MLPRARVALAATVVILVAGASVDAVLAAAPGKAHASSGVRALPVLSAQAIGDINAARTAHGLPRLRLSRPLRAAATFHSYEMARHGFFSHDSLDGTSASARLARFYPSAGYTQWSVGETLLWYAPGVDAARAVRDWLSSPDHRAILLDPDFREVGISAVHATAASGSFQGNEVTIVTADFGLRAR